MDLSGFLVFGAAGFLALGVVSEGFLAATQTGTQNVGH